jgi:hypothetical protein
METARRQHGKVSKGHTLEVITLKDMERAYKLVLEELRQKKTRPIVKKEKVA